jgi:predicted RNase H-like nuclease (RuvC/YqgF family)
MLVATLVFLAGAAGWISSKAHCAKCLLGCGAEGKDCQQAAAKELEKKAAQLKAAEQAAARKLEKIAAEVQAAELAVRKMQELTAAAVQLPTKPEWTGYSTDVLRALIAEMSAHVKALNARGGSEPLKAVKEAHTKL